jgi:hypothetical protein
MRWLPQRVDVSSRPTGPVQRRGMSTARGWMTSPRPLLIAFALGGVAATGCLPKDDLDQFSQAPRGGASGSAGTSGGTGGASAGAAGADADASSGAGGAAGADSGQGGGAGSGLNDAGPDAGDPLDASTSSDSGAPDAS